MLALMGNELADAIRRQLRLALLGQYGTLEAAAEAMGMSYKTLYRHLTEDGKDRTARVSLDFVLMVADHLESVAGIDLSEIYRRASIKPDVRGSSDTRSGYGLAARSKSKDRGEDVE